MRQNKTTQQQKTQKVVEYFSKRESRWGYSLLLRGVKHLGYYPEGKEGISIREAQQLMIEKLYEALDLSPNALLLDAGCGEGSTALYLAQKYKFRIKGIDLLDFSIAKANEKRVRLELENKTEFRVMNYQDLDFPDETFDGVYTMETLVHAADYARALQEFHRVLKPNGKIALFEYSMCPEERMPPELRKITQIVAEESAMPSLSYFLHGKFPEILNQAGFTNVSVENITQRVLPMLKRFSQIAFVPYQFIRLLGLQRKFVNTVAGAEGYRNVLRGDYWRYNVITAAKR